MIILGVFYAQSYYDAQCMKLNHYGAHLTVDGVFCKRQMGKNIIIYRTLDECIKEMKNFNKHTVEPKEMMG